MNKTTTHKDSLDAGAPLEDHELDSVSGGAPTLEQAQTAADNKKQSDAIKAFQRLLQEI
jgi:hypothetical protein